MRSPDFLRADRHGYSILYPETEAAEDWMIEQDEPEMLSGGIVADEELMQAIREAGLKIENDDMLTD